MDIEQLLSQIGPPGKQDGCSRQQRLYEGLRRAILDGQLVSGAKLPATRKIAEATGIARNSVLFAYEQLSAEGFLVSDRQSTRVAIQTAVLKPAPTRAKRREPSAALSKRSQTDALPQESNHLPFAPGVPDLNLFPRQRWARHLQWAWKEVGARHLAYAMPGGEPRLREAIANHLRARRGLTCSAEQVIVTSGAEMALDLCARLLADANDVAWMENPGYPRARATLQSAGLTIVDVPVDADGLHADEKLWQQQPPRLIFVSPSHQYPMGAVMSLERRLALLKSARANRSWVIEDDYDSELFYAGNQTTSLQGLDPDASVVYVGTFSKSLYPGLRIGYMVVPPWASASVTARLRHRYRPGQAMEQLALARFIESGDLARHLRQMRTLYQARQACLRDQLNACFSEEIQIAGGAAGIHLTILFKRKIDDRTLATKAAALGVIARPLSDYYANARVNARAKDIQRGLVLGYGVADEKLIRDLVPRLKRAYDETLAS